VALLGVKSDKKSFDQAKSGFDGILKHIKTAAVALAAFKLAQWAVNAAVAVAKLGDNFDKMSKRVGVSTNTLQEWQHVAQLSGTSLGEMELAIRRLQKSSVEAAQGSARAKEAFEALGVETQDATGKFKDAETLLPEIADGFKNLEDSTMKTAIAQQILGRGGTSMIPMLEQGSAAIAKQRKEVSELGAVMDDELIGLSTEYIDNTARLERVTEGLKNTIARALLPFMIKLQATWIEFNKTTGKIIRQNIGRVFSGIVRIVSAYAKHMRMIWKVTVDWIDGWDDISKKIGAVGIAIVALGALIMTGPVGLIILLIALVGLAIDDFQTWKEGGDSLFGDMLVWLEKVLGVDIEKWVKDADKAFGQFFADLDEFLVSAMESLFHFIEFLASSEGTMGERWETFTKRMGEVWDTEHNDMARRTVKFVTKDLPEAWGGFKLFMNDLWDMLIHDFEVTIIKGIVDGVKRAVAALRKAFALKNFVRAPGGGDVADKLNTVAKLSGSGPAPFGPSVAGPMAPAGAGGYGPTALTNVEMTINAAPGMSEKRIAEEVSKEVKKATDAGHRDAMAAMVPQAVG